MTANTREAACRSVLDRALGLPALVPLGDVAIGLILKNKPSIHPKKPHVAAKGSSLTGFRCKPHRDHLAEFYAALGP